MPSIHRIANTHIGVEVSSLGAEMQSLKTADGRDWLWNGDAAFWTGRSPVLFPIVGKADGNKVAVNGREFDMGQHGFARRSEFSLTLATPVMCRFELASTDATRAVYPFDFVLAVEHILDGPKLTVAAEVENRDSVDMPFSLGFHPAFLWPLPGAEGKPHTVTLDNGADPALTRLDDGLFTDDKLPSPFSGGSLTLDKAMFEADAMIFAEGAGDGLTYAAEAGPALKFSFDNLPNLALWQKVGAPFICIEPWHGMAAKAGAGIEIGARPSSMVLPAGEKARFAFSVEPRG